MGIRLSTLRPVKVPEETEVQQDHQMFCQIFDHIDICFDPVRVSAGLKKSKI